VYKGSECRLTDAVKSRDKKLERQKRKKLKEYEEQEKYDELLRIAEEFSDSYVDSLTINDTIN
jgi:hypothetical protein